MWRVSFNNIISTLLFIFKIVQNNRNQIDWLPERTNCKWEKLKLIKNDQYYKNNTFIILSSQVLVKKKKTTKILEKKFRLKNLLLFRYFKCLPLIKYLIHQRLFSWLKMLLFTLFLLLFFFISPFSFARKSILFSFCAR